MADITELYKQRQALDEQIQNAINEAKEGGEVITVDGRDFSSFIDFEGKLQDPKLTDLIPLYRKDTDGDIDLNYTGERSVQELIDLFGAEATTLLQQAIEAGETSVEDISNAKTDALAAIGESDSAGARGNAISSINAAKTAALGAIGESNTEGARGSAISALDSHVENNSKPAINQYVDNTTKPSIDQYVNGTSKPAIDSYVNDTSKPALDAHTADKKAELDSYVTSTSKPALDSYTTEKKGEIDTETTAKLNEALAAIGKTDSDGARGEAITALQVALTSALDAIGRTNDEGARKAAIDAINTALNSALSQIGQTDGEGARKAALDAISSALTSAKTEISSAKTAGVDAIGTAKNEALAAIGTDNNTGARKDAIDAINALIAEFNTKVTQANDTIDGKVTEATDKANAAAGSASEAEDAAALAKKWASNPVDQPVEGTGETAEYSAEHWAKKAEEAANSPAANETTLGRVRITTNPDYAKPSGVTDPVAASIESLQSVRTAVNTALSKLKVMTSEQLNAAIQKAIDEYKAQAQTQGIDLNDTAFLNGGG